MISSESRGAIISFVTLMADVLWFQFIVARLLVADSLLKFSEIVKSHEKTSRKKSERSAPAPRFWWSGRMGEVEAG